MGSLHAAPRWWQRVLPVTVLVVVVVAVAAVLLPGVRDQLRLSATHEPQRYVELGFARSATGTLEVCSAAGRDAHATFTVTSHLADARDLAYVVTAGGVRRTGTVTVDPGRSVTVDETLRGAGRRYQLDVRLPDLDQRVHAACPGQWSTAGAAS
ncbi:hypothetical protein [Nocardioides mangrovi]|uniref:DUF4307 domain-containing protein n=1 Tax=Nocardioides mangrovi TaxID=2874580 RepID=A0ABS7U9W9_9ACTN|nr:hypothetical protein [Nocardioides mangrovi]MBZ5737662.1 hypothetical protein [Nocardioides mangrovi]